MTYKIDFDCEDYFNLDLDIFTLKKTVGKAMGRAQFNRYWLDNTALAEYWEDIGASWVDVGLNNAKAPDIAVWNGPHLVLNSRALTVMQKHLESYGEFLPLTVDGELHTLFYCKRMVDVDAANSEIDTVEGIFMGVSKIAFNQSTIVTNLLFKTDFDRCRGLYCGDAFKELCEENDLCGLTFSVDLLG